MERKKLKLKTFPLILMLVAGSFTSIMTYYFQYEIKTAILVLLSVLLVFYCIGLFFVSVIDSFDKKNEKERLEREKEQKAKEQEEGVVSEKDSTQEERIVK